MAWSPALDAAAAFAFLANPQHDGGSVVLTVTGANISDV
jgi:hypothetical protein